MGDVEAEPSATLGDTAALEDPVTRTVLHEPSIVEPQPPADPLGVAASSDATAAKPTVQAPERTPPRSVSPTETLQHEAEPTAEPSTDLGQPATSSQSVAAMPAAEPAVHVPASNPSPEAVPALDSFSPEDLSRIAKIQAVQRGKFARRKLAPQADAPLPDPPPPPVPLPGPISPTFTATPPGLDPSTPPSFEDPADSPPFTSPENVTGSRSQEEGPFGGPSAPEAQPQELAGVQAEFSFADLQAPVMGRVPEGGSFPSSGDPTEPPSQALRPVTPSQSGGLLRVPFESTGQLFTAAQPERPIRATLSGRKSGSLGPATPAALMPQESVGLSGGGVQQAPSMQPVSGWQPERARSLERSLEGGPLREGSGLGGDFQGGSAEIRGQAPWFLRGVAQPDDQSGALGREEESVFGPPVYASPPPLLLTGSCTTEEARLQLACLPPTGETLSSVRLRLMDAALREADLRMEAEMAAVDAQELTTQLQAARQLAAAEGQLRRQLQADLEKVREELRVLHEHPAVQQASELSWQLRGAAAAMKALERQVQSLRIQAAYETERRERAESDLRVERSRNQAVLSARTPDSSHHALQRVQSAAPALAVTEFDEALAGGDFVSELQDQVAKLSGALAQSQQNNASLISWAVPSSPPAVRKRRARTPLLEVTAQADDTRWPEAECYPPQVREGSAAGRLQSICEDIHEARSRSSSPPRRPSFLERDLQAGLEAKGAQKHMQESENWEFQRSERSDLVPAWQPSAMQQQSSTSYGASDELGSAGEGVVQRAAYQTAPAGFPDVSSEWERDVRQHHVVVPPNRMPESVLKEARLDYSYQKDAVRQKRLRELQAS